MDDLLTVVEFRVHEIKMWMQCNMLKLNNGKTELSTLVQSSLYLVPKTGTFL